MLVLADTDPFDDRVKKTGAESGSQQGSAYLTCIEEFTRVLRVTADSAWEFCEFGYAAQRPAFETTEPMKFIWVSVEDDASRREHQRRLSRRTSTLSQCSTTERRWLMSQEPSSSLAATQASSPAGIETLASRRQSRALSPPLTARSSVSDFAASAAALDSTRMMTIDSALSKYAAAAATAASISATVSGLPGSGSGSGNNINGPKTLKRRPLGGSRMFSAPIKQAEDAEQLPTAQDLQATNKIELNQETNQEISSKDGVKAYDDDEEEFVASADTLTEASKVAINTVAVAEALDKDMQEIEPASAPTSPAANKPYGERNPYARAPRNYKRSSRSSFSSTQRTPPPSALSNPLAAEVFVAPQIDQEDVLRRPFSRMTNPEVASDLAEPVRRRSSRSYSRSSPAPSRQQQLQQPRSGRLGNSRIPRPPTSSSVSTASSRSTAYSGSMSQVHVVTVDELALALDNL
ncbi:hypothetical protein FB639_003159 [Coemansia asiatica]|nr:hypothetical protein FB639_003159 [Coemansia asiatica]